MEQATEEANGLSPPPLFKINNRVEAQQFDEMLIERAKRWMGGLSMHHISLAKVHDLCQRREADGGKVFTGVLDVQINLAMLAHDLSSAFSLLNRHFIGANQVPAASILDSQEVFDAKMDIHRHITAFIFRYRALWDKIMGVFVRLVAPNEYEGFLCADSRKATFISLMTNHELGDFAEGVSKLLTKFDNEFRTPEAHGEGRLRKFSLSMQSFRITPMHDILGYWNFLNANVATLAGMFDGGNLPKARINCDSSESP